jgi:hypothetical protein
MPPLYDIGSRTSNLMDLLRVEHVDLATKEAFIVLPSVLGRENPLHLHLIPLQNLDPFLNWSKTILKDDGR